MTERKQKPKQLTHIRFLRLERERRGWSQQYVSEKTGIPSPTISAIERCNREMFPAWGKRLSELFGMPAEKLGRKIKCKGG